MDAGPKPPRHTHSLYTCHKHHANNMRSTLFNAVFGFVTHTHPPTHAKFNFDSLVPLTLQRLRAQPACHARYSSNSTQIPRQFHANSAQKRSISEFKSSNLSFPFRPNPPAAALCKSICPPHSTKPLPPSSPPIKLRRVLFSCPTTTNPMQWSRRSA